LLGKTYKVIIIPPTRHVCKAELRSVEARDNSSYHRSMSPFEILMLCCFGAAWPFSIIRSWRSRSTRGKSVGFLWIVLVGYVAGVLHKYYYHRDLVIYLYATNALMVGIDLALYFRNRSMEKRPLIQRSRS